MILQRLLGMLRFRNPIHVFAPGEPPGPPPEPPPPAFDVSGEYRAPTPPQNPTIELIIG